MSAQPELTQEMLEKDLLDPTYLPGVTTRHDLNDGSGSYELYYQAPSYSTTSTGGTGTGSEAGPAPAGDSDWTVLPGGRAFKQISFDGKTLAGVTPKDEIFIATNSEVRTNPEWRQVPGSLKCITVSGMSLFGVNSNDDIFYCPTSLSAAWVCLPGKLKEVWFDGTQLYGVNSANQIFVATEGLRTKPAWAQVPGVLKQVAVHGGAVFGVACDGNDLNSVYTGNSRNDAKWFNLSTAAGQKLTQIAYDGRSLIGVDTNNDIYFASADLKTKPNWRKLDGSARYVTIYGSDIFAVDDDLQVVYRSIAIAPDPFPALPNTYLKQVSFDGKTLAGVNFYDQIFVAKNNDLRTAPEWKLNPGLLKQIDVYGDSLFGVNSIDQIFYEPTSLATPWVCLPGLLKQISFDGIELVGTNAADDIFVATAALTTAPNWRNIPGKLKQAVVHGGKIMASSRGEMDHVYTGSSSGNPNWTNLTKPTNQLMRWVSYDGKRMAGVTSQDEIYLADKNLQTSPNWKKLPGSAKYVSLHGSDLFWVDCEDLLYHTTV